MSHVSRCAVYTPQRAVVQCRRRLRKLFFHPTVSRTIFLVCVSVCCLSSHHCLHSVLRTALHSALPRRSAHTLSAACAAILPITQIAYTGLRLTHFCFPQHRPYAVGSFRARPSQCSGYTWSFVFLLGHVLYVPLMVSFGVHCTD